MPAVAALELLVEQLILERVMMTDSPLDAVRLAMGSLTQIVDQRLNVPAEAVGAVADILARVMGRLIAGER